jgi:hypothetical protein
MLKTKFTNWQSCFILICLLIGTSSLIIGTYFQTISEIESQGQTLFTFQNISQVITDKIIPEPIAIIVPPLPTPEIVKGIYLTGYTFSSATRRQELANLIKTTELNTMVIDIKDPAGKFMFHFSDPRLASAPLSAAVLDNETYGQILSDLQNQKIYTIARVVTFQDDAAARNLPIESLKNKSGAIWQNWKGLTWLDMTNPKAWEIPVIKAREAAALGFDEIQFDYIRFPSDGNIGQIAYYDLPDTKYKYQVLKEFYQYLSQELGDLDIPISIDLFGLTYCLREDENYDLNIGQRLADAALYFDYISPMVYPSHYPDGYLGYTNPADYPYEIIDKALQDGNQIIQSIPESIAQTRPWIQDFNMGAIYNATMVQAEIKAVEDNHASGWLLWNPRNVYTVGALKKIN